jgi:flagellar protein FlaJ
MFVFLAIITILTSTFIPAMTGSGSAGLTQAMGGGSGVKTEEITPIFFAATIVQGFFSGLVAGVFEVGKVSSGVKHMFIIVLVTWFVFKFMIGV